MKTLFALPTILLGLTILGSCSKSVDEGEETRSSSSQDISSSTEALSSSEFTSSSSSLPWPLPTYSPAD